MIEIIQSSTGEKVYIENWDERKTLLALLQEQRLSISAPCDGKGMCGRCRVQFLAGAPVPTEKEVSLLRADELECGVRLACAVHVKGDCRILLQESGEEKMAVLTGAELQTEEVAPQQELSHSIGVQDVNHGYGIAIDIGTTTLAAELFDLADGRTLAVASGVNHQRAYGADVIARIAASNEGKGELLRESIRTDVVDLIYELVKIGNLKYTANDEESAKSLSAHIQKIAIVGNTTMCHLLRGLSCEGMGRAPFTPTDNAWYETDAKTLLGLGDCQAKTTILPGISAFVGADIVAGIFASGIDQYSDKSLFLDIGTNGEMALWHKGKLFVTSTAAGPVFEGGNISCGVPGVPGAICHVACETPWRYETIGNQPPVGLCGSGIIDLTNALMETGYMDENGTLEEPWFTDGVAVAKDAIRFEQRDIREVQMGKAAIRAGIEILLAEESGEQGERMAPASAMKSDESEKLTVYLAGGFGYAIDVENAIRIGMFPESFRGHVIGVGNSALEGAKRYLLAEESARERVDRMIGRATEWNLAEHPAFEDLYLAYMSF